MYTIIIAFEGIVLILLHSKIVYWIERYVLEGSGVLEYTQYIDMRTVKSGLDQGSVPFQLN